MISETCSCAASITVEYSGAWAAVNETTAVSEWRQQHHHTSEGDE